jgi:hypothetical protein
MTRKVIGRDLPGGVYVEIAAEIRDGSDGLSAGFSVTGLLWERHGTWNGRACKRNGRDCDAGGQIVDEIRAAAPELEPIMAVHLADLAGVPMHAETNGWYFYSGGASAWERAQVAAGHDYGYSRQLEVSDHDRAARALNIPPADLPTGLDRAGFGAFVASLADRWAAQAAAARDVFSAMVDGAGVEDGRADR